MADAPVLGAGSFRVWVQVPSLAPEKDLTFGEVFFCTCEMGLESPLRKQSGGLFLGRGVDEMVVFTCTDKRGRDDHLAPTPISRTNKKTSFVYLTKEAFLNDVCLRQMMSFH